MVSEYRVAERQWMPSVPGYLSSRWTIANIKIFSEILYSVLIELISYFSLQTLIIESHLYLNPTSHLLHTRHYSQPEKGLTLYSSKSEGNLDTTQFGIYGNLYNSTFPILSHPDFLKKATSPSWILQGDWRPLRCRFRSSSSRMRLWRWSYIEFECCYILLNAVFLPFKSRVK